MSNFEIIKKIISSYKGSLGKTKFYITLFFGVFVSIIWLVEPFFFVHVIGYIESYINGEKLDFFDIKIFILFWLLFIFLSLIFSYYYRYYIVDRNILDFHNKQFAIRSDKIILMEYNDYLNKKQGSIFKIFDRGLKDQFNFLFFIYLDLIKNISGLVVVITILFFINYKMAFATLLMLPVLIYIGYIVNFKTQKLQKEVNKHWDKSFGFFGDALQNLGLVKTLVLEKIFSKKMEKTNQKALEKQKTVSKRWSISDIYTGFIVTISRVLVLAVGFYLITTGEINFSKMFLFFSFIGYIYFPISFILRNLRNNQEQITSIRNFYDEFDNGKMDTDNGKKKKLKDIKGNIEFKDVCFKYIEGKKVLKNISFKVKSGEKIAFVGNTGAGKSTIVNLLFRFWDVNKGDITIDGININDISKKSLRRSIGLVMQDNTLFNASIKENLRFANNEATDKELEDAIKKAEAGFVFKLDKGLNTIIGERGLKLSGGEKQRLAIARLFLKNPKILVLDEATSALDNKTEKLVQKALDKLMKGRTSIVIAHRLSTIQNSDKIFMLENGQIVESGNYNELMNKKSKFYNLANPEHLIIN